MTPAHRTIAAVELVRAGLPRSPPQDDTPTVNAGRRRHVVNVDMKNREHNKVKRLIVVLVTASALALAGCETMRKEDSGALAGAAIGGAVGHNFGSGSGKVLATFAGAVLGALAGSNIGRRLDMYDEMQAQRALEYNRTGDSTTWVNPDTGKEVTFVPVETYQRESGQYCREYRTRVEVGNQSEEAYGTACRQPDGSWQIQ